MLANLTVVKTFSPDLPGTFAGGALLIETRDYPSKFMLKLRLGTVVDSTATFRQVNTHKGGSLDFLGYDDGDARPARRGPARPEGDRRQLHRPISSR